MKPQKIEISHKTIIFAVLFLVSLFLLWSIRSLIILLFFCFILMEALNPTISKLEDRKIPRPVAILTIYIILLSFIAFVLAGIVPVLIDQTTGLINSLPSFFEKTSIFGFSAIDISSQLKLLEGLPGNIAKAAISIFSNTFSVFVVLVITYYLLLERKNIGKYSFRMFGKNGKKKTLKIVYELEQRLGKWVNAEIFLMSIVGLLSYLGYMLLGLNYAVPLAIFAGLLEIIPNIGPTFSTIVAAIVAFTMSPLTALLTIIWGVIVQQVENNFIVPKIMKETIGLNPLITILLIASGAQLAGVVGAVLAIPIYLTVEVIFNILIGKEN